MARPVTHRQCWEFYDNNQNMAKDIFHNTVKIALQKDGWLITHDPYQLR
ncbi:element excision factor XisH family protein, partial [Moorena sp. SIO3B2]